VTDTSKIDPIVRIAFGWSNKRLDAEVAMFVSAVNAGLPELVLVLWVFGTRRLPAGLVIHPLAAG
jgi:hypothetical protein